MTAAGGFGRLSLLNAMTQPSGSYRALVCIFLYGGNDSNNLIVPLDTANLANYKKYRGGLALDTSSTAVQPMVNFSSGAFKLHSQFTPLSSFLNETAIVANIGTLVKPTTRADYQAHKAPVPNNLFSHADQQGEMQTAEPDGLSTTGWAGRLADQVHALGLNHGTYPAFVSVAGNAKLGLGAATHPGSVTPNVAPGLRGFGTDAGSIARLNALESLVTQDTLLTDSGAVLLRAASNNMNNSLKDSATLATALKSSTALTTAFPNTSIGNQLAQVAKLIQVRDALQMSRQIFFCSLGGFDTHTSQLADQDKLYSQLSAAMAAFYLATDNDLHIADEVTAFTESDFSRTFAPNSNGGTDHAWGSHHIVMGGSVKGNKMYGTFPALLPNGPDDEGGEGRWIPTTAVDQYAATLAQWFGLPAANLPAVFPNIGNFKVADVGFFG